MTKINNNTIKNPTTEKTEKNTNVSISKQQEKKLKQLEYLLQCASAECGW